MPWESFDWKSSPVSPAHFTLAVVGLVFGLLTFSQIATDIVMIGGVSILLLAGVLTPSEALSGMSNEGMITVGVLFVVGAGVRETGAVELIATPLFGRPKTQTTAVARMVTPTMALSATRAVTIGATLRTVRTASG